MSTNQLINYASGVAKYDITLQNVPSLDISYTSIPSTLAPLTMHIL